MLLVPARTRKYPARSARVAPTADVSGGLCLWRPELCCTAVATLTKHTPRSLCTIRQPLLSSTVHPCDVLDRPALRCHRLSISAMSNESSTTHLLEIMGSFRGTESYARQRWSRTREIYYAPFSEELIRLTDFVETDHPHQHTYHSQAPAPTTLCLRLSRPSQWPE